MRTETKLTHSHYWVIFTRGEYPMPYVALWVNGKGLQLAYDTPTILPLEYVKLVKSTHGGPRCVKMRVLCPATEIEYRTLIDKGNTETAKWLSEVTERERQWWRRALKWIKERLKGVE